MKNDPYEILGVSKNDSIEVITQKYRKLALKYHPDKNKSKNIDTTNEFIQISNAYNTIVNNKDKSFNKNFNSNLFNNIAQNIINKSSHLKNMFTNINIENVLKTIVKISDNYENCSDYSEDLYINVNVEIFDIYNCIEKTITINRLRKCKICYGLGIIVNKNDKLKMDLCRDCNGKRYLNSSVNLTFNCKYKNYIFEKKSHEYLNTIPGNIYLNIIPKINNNYNIYNYYDLICYHNIDLSNNIDVSNNTIINIKHLDNKFYKFKINNPIYNFKYKIDKLGLYDLEENNRGNLYIILENKNYINKTNITKL